MENKYQEGKIYKIIDNTNGNIYIGSTKNTLDYRLKRHKFDKTCMSKQIIEQGDYEIILIKDYPCNSKWELEEEEAKYIRNNTCINRCIPHRTQKQYREENNEAINKQRKQYREKNKETLNNIKKEKILCDCGKMVSKNHLARHKKTKKNLKFRSTI